MHDHMCCARTYSFGHIVSEYVAGEGWVVGRPHNGLGYPVSFYIIVIVPLQYTIAGSKQRRKPNVIF